MSCYRAEVDIIITNAKIYSVDDSMNIYSFMAIKDGRIVHISKEDESANFDAKENINLEGKPVYPGFYDAHCHFFGYANSLRNVDLRGCISFSEVIERVKAHRKKYPETQWIRGRGWDQNLWEEKSFPNRYELDSLFPETPVLLTRIDGHATLVNGKALELAGISKETQVEGGKIVVENDKCTGILIDNAEELVNEIVPDDSEEIRVQSLLEAEKNCFEVGLTTLADAGVDIDLVRLTESLQESGDLKMKLYLMLSQSEEGFKYAQENGIVRNDRLHIRSFKLYSDGALGSRGACLIESYSDDPENRGFLLKSENDLDEIVKRIYDSGYQLNTHAIGDSANRIMLDLYARYLKGENDLRWRIEHAQVVHPDDLPKFGEYDIIPSVQPTHCTSDMFWADERLGEDRLQYAYAYKNLLNSGGIVAMGSDFPIEKNQSAAWILLGHCPYRFRRKTIGRFSNGKCPESRGSFERNDYLGGLQLF